MNKIKVFLIFTVIVFASIFNSNIKAQGDLSTPYSISGWDSPIDFTIHYNLPVYQLLSNPGGWININQRMIDSLFYALVVYTKTNQMAIVNDTLVLSDSLSGIASFTGTDVVDTVAIRGLRTIDVVVASVRDTIPTANDNLGVYVATDTAYIKRNAAGISGLKYNWIWVKK